MASRRASRTVMRSGTGDGGTGLQVSCGAAVASPPDQLLHVGVLAVANARGESLPFLGRRVTGGRRDPIRALGDCAGLRLPAREDLRRRIATTQAEGEPEGER